MLEVRDLMLLLLKEIETKIERLISLNLTRCTDIYGRETKWLVWLVFGHTLGDGLGQAILQGCTSSMLLS